MDRKPFRTIWILWYKSGTSTPRIQEFLDFIYGYENSQDSDLIHRYYKKENLDADLVRP